jgi:hypothetical protein
MSSRDLRGEAASVVFFDNQVPTCICSLGKHDCTKWVIVKSIALFA